MEAARLRLAEVLNRALELAERIKACSREVDCLVAGIEGGFIEPGPSGSLTRGKIEVLPTGRNFYAVDPTSLPTKAAWRVGVEAAEKLIEEYLRRHGRYPESVGFWLWSLDAYKADGEQLAQILHLMGVRPRWEADGSVKGVEVVPLEELGRPRIDVVVRITGIVRDTLPNYIYLIDEAACKVASLDEPLDVNYVRKHYVEHASKLASMGRDPREALCRVWCSPPGSYGAGVNYAVEASAWRGDEDLAKVWVHWSCYMYTRDEYGKPSPEALMLSLKSVDVVTRNHPTDEHDPLNCCCYFAYHGGFYNAVKSVGGREAEIVIVDTRDLSQVQVRSMKDEVERVVRAKLLNPAWISAMASHGYRGANELSRKILHLYGWSATARIVEGWVFEEIARRYVLDEEMRRWFMEHNPWALEEIARRLIEAAERGLWSPSEELLNRLREVYGELEGVMEESMVGEGVQGGSTTWVSPSEDEHWRSKMGLVEEAWRRVVGSGA